MNLKKQKRPYINTDAGDVPANVAAFNHAATGGNMMGEDLNQTDIYDLVKFIDYNGAEFRGAEIPEADPFMINQINIPDNMRLKWFDVDILDDNTLQLTYTTQEEFDSEDSDKFIAEVKRFFEALLEREGYEKPLSVALDVECRSGEEYGKLLYDLDFNKENKMKTETLTEDKKVNLDNVVEVEEKSKEVVDPGFADGVREIKDNEEKVDELERVRKAPEQGKEALSDDIKFTLDESLFESILNETGEWEDDEEGLLMKQELSDTIRDITGQNISIEHIKGFDKYMGPYYYDGEYEYWLGEMPETLFVKDNFDHWYLVTSIDDFRDLRAGKREIIFNESIKTRRGIKRIDNLKESEEEYTVKEYLDDVRYFGDGYITVDKIELDIDQGGYKFKTSDVLNAATKAGWQFTDDPDDGLLISFNKRIIKEEITEETFTADMKLRDAYRKYDPDEYQLDRLRNDITLEYIWKALQDGKDIYEFASVDGDGFDSAVREGIFNILEETLGVDYDTIFKTWLHGNRR